MSLKVKVVFDTNVLISALVFPGGVPHKLFKLAREKSIKLYASDLILSEVERVPHKKFRLTRDEESKL